MIKTIILKIKAKNMKKYFLYCLLCLQTSISFCQNHSEKELKKHADKIANSKEKNSVVLSLDTIFNAGNPYAILKTEKSFLTKNYKLFSLKGVELAYLRFSTIETKNINYYAFLFFDLNKTAEVEMYIGINIPKIIVENNLVNDSTLNISSVNKFLMKFPQQYSQQTKTTVDITEDATKYATVERDRKAMLQFFGSEIQQDFKVIGTVKETSNITGGKIYKVFTFKLPNGITIAEATQNDGDINNNSYKIVTIKNNLIANISINRFGADLEELTKFLIERYYL